MNDNYLIYDGDCPFCHAYVEKIRVDRALDGIAVVNAREAESLVARLSAAGYDLNEGMVLAIDGRLYHGSECVQRLALMSTSSAWFNRLAALVLKRPRAAALLYPCLRAGRNTVLKLMGRPPIAAARPADGTE
jgi:predicted DCC family thiol-disulfide oxidoreductase YuxK